MRSISRADTRIIIACMIARANRASLATAPIVRIVQAQRATFYCPACQAKRNKYAESQIQI